MFKEGFAFGEESRAKPERPREAAREPKQNQEVPVSGKMLDEFGADLKTFVAKCRGLHIGGGLSEIETGWETVRAQWDDPDVDRHARAATMSMIGGQLENVAANPNVQSDVAVLMKKLNTIQNSVLPLEDRTA